MKLGQILAHIASALALAPVLIAGPSLTTIDDTLYKADGSLFEGVLMINWKSFEGPGSANVPANRLTVRVRNGRLFAKLVPTTTAPTAAYYSVRYVASGSVEFTELWSVPPSDSALRVRDIRIAWPPATTALTAPATDISITDVAGLEAALDARASKGGGYPSPEDENWEGRVAVIGVGGLLVPASGSLEDCLRLDGSTGPCGSDSSTTGFVDNEAPVGAVNGANTLYSLSEEPAPQSSLLLYRNGLLQRQGLDYTVSGTQVTFLAASTPQTGDLLLASYRSAIELTTTFGFTDAETPSGAIDGLNDTFALAGAPAPVDSLLLHRNGLLQKRGVDYTVSGNTIVFTSVSVPQPGDILLASYRTSGS